jgi:hypothetical protein
MDIRPHPLKIPSTPRFDVAEILKVQQATLIAFFILRALRRKVTTAVYFRRYEHHGRGRAAGSSSKEAEATGAACKCRYGRCGECSALRV